MNRFQQRRTISWLSVLVVVGTLVISEFQTVLASDHLDTPTVIADPAADIGDIFAWTSSDGKRLNLVMDIVAHQFSDRLQYVFHVDSGRAIWQDDRNNVDRVQVRCSERRGVLDRQCRLCSR